MIGGTVVRYIQQWNYRRQARAWMRGQGDPARVACDAMYQLNRYALHADEGDRYAVYAYKNCLIRYLYQSGYCIQVRRDVQVLKCYKCV